MVIAVREALGGKSHMSQSLSRDAVDCFAVATQEPGEGKGRGTERLTARQREVLQLLAEGRVMKEVATLALIFAERCKQSYPPRFSILLLRTVAVTANTSGTRVYASAAKLE